MNDTDDDPDDTRSERYRDPKPSASHPPACTLCLGKYPDRDGICGYCRADHERRLAMVKRVNCVDPTKVPGIRVVNLSGVGS